MKINIVPSKEDQEGMAKCYIELVKRLAKKKDVEKNLIITLNNGSFVNHNLDELIKFNDKRLKKKAQKLYGHYLALRKQGKNITLDEFFEIV